MAGFAFKELYNANIPGTGVPQNIDMFTVPAGHTYMIKRAHLRIIRTVAGADTFTIQRSDTAGINFRNVFQPITTPAAAQTDWVNLTPSVPVVSGINPTVAEASATAQATLENLICEAGTKLRIVIPGGLNGADSIDVAIDGVDNTL